MSVEYTIICDHCGNLLCARRQSAGHARAELRSLGGRTNLPGGLDLCPTCVKDGHSADPAHTSPRSRR